MILTTSALRALWQNAPDASRLHTAIMRSPVRAVSAATRGSALATVSQGAAFAVPAFE